MQSTPSAPTASLLKETHATVEKEVPPPLPPRPTEDARPKVMEGAVFSLLLGAFLPCIPVAIVCAVLLTIVFRNRIEGPYTVFQEVQEATDLSNQTLTDIAGGKMVYWLWANKATSPGTLHTIASVTGKVIPYITSTLMALVAFFAARRIMMVTRSSKKHSMPTADQMPILVGLLNGDGISPLWRTLKHRFRKHEPLVQPLPLAFWSLTWILVLTVAIQAVDSWFGVVVRPAIVDIVKTTNETLSYGRRLSPEMCSSALYQMPCVGDGTLTCNYPCSIAEWNTSTDGHRFGVQHAQEAAEVLMNNSYTNMVVNLSTGNYGTQHHFLADKRTSANLDFITNTLAVTTQCQVITQNCNISTGFTCGNYTAASFAWTGAVGMSPMAATGLYNESSVGIQFFTDSSLNTPVGNNMTEGLFTTLNPAPFLVWSKGFPPVDTSADQFASMRQGHYYDYDISGDPVFILNCSMAINQAKYNWTNGGVSADGLYDLELADPSYGAIYSAAFAMDTSLGHLSLQDAAALAAYQTEPDLLATSFANQISRAASALTAGITIPSQNAFEQERFNNILVTKVPLIPLYVLVALKAIYALFALLLASLAIVLAEPITSYNVKECLTIDGLAASMFGSKDHLETGVADIEKIYQKQGVSRGSKMPEPPIVGVVEKSKGG